MANKFSFVQHYTHVPSPNLSRRLRLLPLHLRRLLLWRQLRGPMRIHDIQITQRLRHRDQSIQRLEHRLRDKVVVVEAQLLLWHDGRVSSWRGQLGRVCN